MASWLHYTLDGLVVGNLYALLALGLALIFRVSGLVNFAHGSVYTAGAFAGWLCVTRTSLPWPMALVAAAATGAVLGLLVERLCLRGLRRSSAIAPLLATIGLGLALDQLMQTAFGAEPRGVALPWTEQAWRLGADARGDGGVAVSPLDALIAGLSLGLAAALYGFLHHTRLGWAVSAVAQDAQAAEQMGVRVRQVQQAVFAIASALGGVSGFLVGLYYNHIDPNMGFAATLKGVVALAIGGMGSLPGAVLGSLLLGVTESWGVALWGASWRNLFAFALLLGFLVWRPTGLLGDAAAPATAHQAGSFTPLGRWWSPPPWLVWALVALAVSLPWWSPSPYVLQVLGNAWLFGLMALSLTLVAGTVGQVSLGHGALLLVGAYISALLATEAGWPPAVTVPLAALATGVLGVMLVWPAFRLQGHYLAMATLGIGEIVGLLILNGDPWTHGPLGVAGIPPLVLAGLEVSTPGRLYAVSLAALLAGAWLLHRLLASHLGRTWRALRDDETAARAHGVDPLRYKALAFGIAGVLAGLSGALTAHAYAYINHQTFDAQTSITGLTMAILGGLGNLWGAALGAVLLSALPELFRQAAEHRMLVYGLVLLALVRWRPRGLLGSA